MPAKNHYFISDIHLGLLDPEIERQREKSLVACLNQLRQDAAALYIVGDLFDYWFEYRRVTQKGFFRLMNALALFTDEGIPVHYVIGNHDFMHRDFFASEVGVTLHQDGFEQTICGKRFFIAHGDGLVKNDVGYRILKAVLRNKKVQWAYSWLHPDIGIAIAGGTSKSSRKYTAKKDYGEGDGMFDAASRLIDQGYDYVIFGHSHFRRFQQHANGTYVNLGTWLEAPCYGACNEAGFTIVDWKS